MAETQADSLGLHLDKRKWDEVDGIAKATERSRQAVVGELSMRTSSFTAGKLLTSKKG